MTIDFLTTDKSPAVMSSAESINTDSPPDSYEHSPLLLRRRSPKSATPPSRRHHENQNRWTISELAMHQENMTEMDILATGASSDLLSPRARLDSRSTNAMDCSGDSPPVRYRRRRERTRSASLPFLMLSNLQLQQIQPRIASSALRVVVLGEAGVGKSALIQQFLSCVDNEWPDNDYITDESEQTYCKSISVDDDQVDLEIVDTPPYSSEDFEAKEEEYLRSGDAFLLVYSVTNRRSFKKANELRFKLQRSKESETVPIILVGNKNDLERSREVSFGEGKHFAALFDCKLMETSATIGLNVDELFHGVVRQVRLRREKNIEDSETTSAGSNGSGDNSPSMGKKHYSKKRRGSTVLNRAKGILEKIRNLRGEEPIPGYRARSKSCHVMEVL